MNKKPAKKIFTSINKALSKKIVKKPAKKSPSYSGQKIVLQLAKEQGSFVREVPNPYADPVQDNRSLFFREDYAAEKRKRFGGFI